MTSSVSQSVPIDAPKPDEMSQAAGSDTLPSASAGLGSVHWDGDANVDWQHAGFAVNAPPVEPTHHFQTKALKAGHPDPSAVRPGRRIVVTAILFLFAGYAAFFVWNSMFRFRALGVVSAETIEISLDSDALVQKVAVAEGARVEAGDLLAVLENKTLHDELARVCDEFEIAKAEVTAEASRLQWELEVAQDGRYRLKAELHLEQGNTREQEASVESLGLTFQRQSELKARGSVNLEDYDRARFALKGQTGKVAMRKEAVGDLQRRSEMADSLVARLSDRLTPKVARVNALHSETERLRGRLLQLSVRAPIGGTVVKRCRLPGERLRANEPLITLLADATREAVLYVSESSAGTIGPGDEVVLTSESASGPLRGTVAQVEDRLQPAPESIQTFYRRGERLLAIHVKPDRRFDPWPGLPLNSIIKLSRWDGVTRKGASR